MLVGRGLTAAWETKLFDQLPTSHFKLPGSACPKHLQPSRELLITFIMVPQQLYELLSKSHISNSCQESNCKY